MDFDDGERNNGTSQIKFEFFIKYVEDIFEFFILVFLQLLYFLDVDDKEEEVHKDQDTVSVYDY